jgi:GNAT superfamily N-acetyltransferase
MHEKEKVRQVSMIRPGLDGIPDCALPAGYAIRWYEKGDESMWAQIQQQADQYNTITPQTFAHEFGTDVGALEARQCYLYDSAMTPIGTASAWYGDARRGADWGRVHWVAILPDMQGRGLSKPLLTIICHRLRELGHTRTYLDTETPRIPAICLYLKFGFVPEIACDADTQAWRLVRSHLPDRFRDTPPLDRL